MSINEHIRNFWGSDLCLDYGYDSKSACFQIHTTVHKKFQFCMIIESKINNYLK